MDCFPHSLQNVKNCLLFDKQNMFTAKWKSSSYSVTVKYVVHLQNKWKNLFHQVRVTDFRANKKQHNPPHLTTLTIIYTNAAHINLKERVNGNFRLWVQFISSLIVAERKILTGICARQLYLPLCDLINCRKPFGSEERIVPLGSGSFTPKPKAKVKL